MEGFIADTTFPQKDKTVSTRRAIPDAMSWRHHNSSVSEPSPLGVRAEDIRQLCENVVDLRLVYLVILYEIGLTTIWKHVGHHPTFKDSERNVGTRRLYSEQFWHSSLCSLLTTVIPDNVNVGAGDSNQISQDVEHKEEETGNDSNPNDVNEQGEINSPHFASSPHSVHSTHSDRSLHSEDQHNVRFRDYDLHRSRNDNIKHAATGSTGRVVSSSSGGSGRLDFPTRHLAGDKAGMPSYFPPIFLFFFFYGTPVPFVLAWNLTTGSNLNDTESCRDMIIILLLLQSQYEALNDDCGELYQAYSSCQELSERLMETQNQLVEALCSRTILFDDHKALRQVYLSCVDKEASLVEKLAAIEREKDDLLDKNKAQGERLNRNLERLTVDLAQTKIVRHILPIVVQRLLSSDEYKKDLSDVFNQAIAAGWSKGVQVGRKDEEIQAILATAQDYDLECKSTFMSAFDGLFVKSYPYVEKLVESFRLPLGAKHVVRM
ncbi:hypothetical protein Tco_0039153 [Tanacetum coccineum]